ncbi:hypothetical protein [Kutzneria chonburiensis]|uniref:Uncharacterized protein n=1 Tax=Kutzneria chonburiensis TaxID=1483604 RepID=A0ABV6MNQ9_9PSEU|nr:hypothetical protein [Kutzneria chonburiensis]
MTTPLPVPADEEVAAAVFASHIARVSASAQARAQGWVFTPIDPLHAVVTVAATRATGEKDLYYVLLGAEYYDSYPPTTSFVCPPANGAVEGTSLDQWKQARKGGRWFPLAEGLSWFAVHDSYQFQFPSEDAYSSPRQLVCCSATFEYYISGHNPTESQRWRQGRHTLAATLDRIQEALDSANYGGPSGADDS